MLGVRYLSEAYDRRETDYPGGVSVPAVVDVPSGKLVTNDYQQITLDFATEWTALHRAGAPDLYPEKLRDEIDAVMDDVFRDVNNGCTGRASPPGRRSTRPPARGCSGGWSLWRSGWSAGRYLVGDTITEADIRLFTTLVRFDPVYHGHFKCNRWKLTESRVLWGYARDLFQTPGFGDTVDFDHIKRHYYQVHTGVNPSGIVPLGPDLAGWTTPHHREELGGRPFGDGTPPPAVPPGEEVPARGRPDARPDPSPVRRSRPRRSDVAKKSKKAKKKLPLAYKPIGFALGWTSGTVAGMAFQKTWKVIKKEDDAPDALDRDRGWGEILLAAAIQGAIFAVVRSAVDRAGAKAIERSTGTWPVPEKGGRD